MNIRGAAPEDIPRLIKLEQDSAEAAHWAEQHYRDAIGRGPGAAERLFLVAQHSAEKSVEDSTGAIVGFLVARHLAPEWELENIVVAASARRNGIGARLLKALLDHAHKTNSTSVFLEVRESNVPARALYERAGFQQSGRRKSYYANPQEDAIVYTFSSV